MNFIKTVAVAASASLALLAIDAQAAFTEGGYCSLNTQTGGIGTGDVTLEGAEADDCYGLVDIGGNVAGEISNINALGFGTYSATNYLKDDTSGSATASFLGLNWQLSAANGSGNGSWTLTVNDPDPAMAPNLPLSIDILVFLKAGTPGAFFWFKDVVINTSQTGTFEINWTNNGGRVPGLSGMSLFFGSPTTIIVPESGTLMLFALALLGLGFASRRRVR